MNYNKNEKGIALVTALLITLISLAIILAVIYLSTQGTKTSGLTKRYQTALDASNGGVEVLTKDIIPQAIGSSLSAVVGSLPSAYQNMISYSSGSNACFNTKLLQPTSNWGTCNDSSLDPTSSPDMTIKLSGISPQPDFMVYAKIVDTVQGNTDTSGLMLQGTGVVESGSGIVTPQHNPYIYRIEIQGQRDTANPDERAKLSVLYAY